MTLFTPRWSLPEPGKLSGAGFPLRLVHPGMGDQGWFGIAKEMRFQETPGRTRSGNMKPSVDVRPYTLRQVAYESRRS